MTKKSKILVISVKPKFANKIFSGEKTIELRKSAPKQVEIGSFVLLYVTAPVKELWGMYKITNIHKEKVELFWENFSDHFGISEKEYLEYYFEKEYSYGIEIETLKELKKYSIKLSDLQKTIPNFRAPQTYSYIDSNLIDFKFLKKLIS